MCTHSNSLTSPNLQEVAFQQTDLSGDVNFRFQMVAHTMVSNQFLVHTQPLEMCAPFSSTAKLGIHVLVFPIFSLAFYTALVRDTNSRYHLQTPQCFTEPYSKERWPGFDCRFTLRHVL